MNKDLEFHYVVSYRECYGWTIAMDTAEVVMSDGSIYEWYPEGGGQWFNAYEDSEDDENSSIAGIDTKHYHTLRLALQQLNYTEGE